MSTTTTEDGFGRFAPSDYTIAQEYVAVFGGFRVPEPESVFGSTAVVTHDTFVRPDGSVDIRINGVPLSDVGTEQGSYVY